MKQEIKDEALKQLEQDILFGFESEEELFESISEMFYNEDDFDNKWLKTKISTAFLDHQKESLHWEKPTDFDRIVQAFDQLNKEKIVSLHKAGYTRQDAESDCNEIIQELSAIGITAKGYCYYHAQDLEGAIQDNGVLYIGYGSIDQNGKAALLIANQIVAILELHGFQTEWNGSLDKRIEIKSLNWKKAYDNTDYNYGRVFQYLKNSTNQLKRQSLENLFGKYGKRIILNKTNNTY